MSTHTPDSRRRRATPRQIARAVRRGPVAANPRPRPPLPQVSAAARPRPSLAGSTATVPPHRKLLSTESPHTVAPEFAAAGEERFHESAEEPVRRWGPALFFSNDDADAPRDRFGWVAGLRERLPRRSPYSWRERDWRVSSWAYRIRVLPIVAAVLIAMLVVGTFAFVVASRAAAGAATGLHTISSSNSSAPQTSGGVILQQPASGAPTPAAPTYTVGVWVTNDSPGAGGTEQVYVRVSNNANPVGHAPVTLSITWGSGGSSYGPALTDSYGLASFQVIVGGPPGQPEFVTATASAGKTSVSADTVFVPVGGGASSSGNGDGGGNGNGHGHRRGTIFP
ncbi:MAG: hypothetical protein ACRDHP_07330 [Ktedonobacterales bacterium]